MVDNGRAVGVNQLESNSFSMKEVTAARCRCVYIETASHEVMAQPLHGFFAHLEHDANRLGAAFRQARAKVARAAPSEQGQGERTSPRPHMRRAHFHTFWTGPRQEPSRRRAVVRWLPPIPVGFEGDEDDLPAVIRRVRR